MEEVITSLDQQISDSEENYINTSFWRILPFYQMIRRGQPGQIRRTFNIQIDMVDFHARVTKDRRREIEYMSISLVNTFMIAAITGGVYPPDANRAADDTLRRLGRIHRPDEINPLITGYAIDLAEMVKKLKQSDTGNPHVEHAKQYIRTHLSQKITLDDIARHCGISRCHLSRIFREAAGKSLQDWLCEERIETAKELLLTTDRTIASIASLLQFCDQSYFVAVFRKKTGMTPGQYRKQNYFRAAIGSIGE